MKTIELLSKLEKVDFTTEQARTISEAMEDRQGQLATKDDLKMSMDFIRDEMKTLRDDMKTMATNMVTRDDLKTMASKDYVNAIKYDLVRWIIGTLLINGIIATLFKFLA